MKGLGQIRKRLAKLLIEDNDPSDVCEVKLDRVEFSSTFGLKPPAIPGFVLAKIKPEIFLRHKNDVPAYTRVRRLFNPMTRTTASVRYNPNRKLLKPMKCTVIANDHTGITAKELRGIIAAFGDLHCVTLAEFAFDFDPDAGVDLNFVRRFGVFGKSRPENDERYPDQQRYGTRKSSRFVRAYPKEEIGVFRVEVQITSRWLRESDDQNRTIFRFRSLRIFPNDFLFATMDWESLGRSLNRLHHNADLIIRESKRHSHSIQSLLQHLRDEIGIRNPDHFLRPLKINVEVAKAWNHWTRHFCFKPKSRSASK